MPDASAGIFRPLPLVLVRAPAFPESAFSGLDYDTFDLDAACADPSFAEALDVANPTLLRQIRAALHNKDHESLARLRRLTLRYGLRASGRATPFGLFAGVAVGEYGASPAADLGPRKGWRKRSRPDMGWLLSLIATLELDPGVLDAVVVFANSTARRLGSRLVIPYVPVLDDPTASPRTNVSIRATPPALRAMSLAVDGCRLADIAGTGAEAARRRRLVCDLVAAGFLVTDLTPPPGHPDPLGYVAAILATSAQAALAVELRGISALLRQFDDAPSGQALPVLEEARSRMALIQPGIHYVQTDLSFPQAHVILPESVGAEVAQAAEMLWRLSALRPGLPQLRPYHEAFLERYGLDREVSISELISEESGLGVPANYIVPRNSGETLVPTDAPHGPRVDAIARRVLVALQKGEAEVSLDPADVADIPDPDPSQRPMGIELMAEIVASSTADLEAGNYQIALSPIIGSDGIGKLFGRFLDILDSAAVLRLREALAAQESLRPDLLHAELLHSPPRGRLYNLTYVAPLHHIVVQVGTAVGGTANSAIPLSDIVVGADPDSLYLRSRCRGSRLLITAPNMLSNELLPSICRLLLDISSDSTRHLHSLDLGSLAGAPRLPRIRCGRVILVPATWRLAPADIAVAPGASPAEWQDAFQRWRQDNRVPTRVALSHADQRLTIDCTSSSHIAELHRELDRRKGVTLVEIMRGSNGLASGAEGRHRMECVFPLLGSSRPRPESPFLRDPRPVADELRVRLPGSDWLYLKIYGSQRRHDDLLCDYVESFAAGAVELEYCSTWHFLRYADPRTHIRLRFHGNSPHSLLPQLASWIAELRDLGLVHDFEVATYAREVERYGGPDLIELAEEVFGGDSRSAMALLRIARTHKDLPTESLAAFGIVDLFDQLCLPGVDLTQWADCSPGSRLPTQVISLALALWGNPAGRERSQPAAAALGAALELRAPAAGRFGAALANDDARIRRRRIVSSLVHMHCNRLGLADASETLAVEQAVRLARWRHLARRRNFGGGPGE